MRLGYECKPAAESLASGYEINRHRLFAAVSLCIVLDEDNFPPTASTLAFLIGFVRNAVPLLGRRAVQGTLMISLI